MSTPHACKWKRKVFFYLGWQRNHLEKRLRLIWPQDVWERAGQHLKVPSAPSIHVFWSNTCIWLQSICHKCSQYSLFKMWWAILITLCHFKTFHFTAFGCFEGESAWKRITPRTSRSSFQHKLFIFCLHTLSFNGNNNFLLGPEKRE